METGKKIVLFDGVCNLCNGFIQFIIKRDKNDVFRFASLQSEKGKQLISEHHIDIKNLDTVILIDPGTAYYLKSDVALQIGKELKPFVLLSRVLTLIPSILRNIIYDLIAKYRYAWFGKKEACMIPTPELQSKFLD